MPIKLTPKKRRIAQSRELNQKSGWKAHKMRLKIKKKTKLAILVLIMLLVVVLLGAILRLHSTFLSSWKFKGVTKNYLWNGQFNINLVVLTNSVSLVTFNPKEEIITILNLPPQTYLEVPGGFGHWQLRAIFNLGKSEKKGGGKLVKETLSQFLGIHLDGFLALGESGENLTYQKSAKEIIDVLRANPISGITLLSDLKTDLTLWELVKLKWAFWQVRFDKVKSIDILDFGVLDKETLADGTSVYTTDPVKLDSILTYFTDPSLREESLSIAVFNATDYPQLAQRSKRIITNLGGRVIALANAEGKEGKIKRTYIVGPNSKTKTRLLQIFDLGCSEDPKCDKIVPQDLGLASMRSQISLILGEDFVK